MLAVAAPPCITPFNPPRDGQRPHCCDQLEISTTLSPNPTRVLIFIQCMKLSPMRPALTLVACGQRRKRPLEVEPEHEHTLPPESQWKRAKFCSAQEARTAFWDNLSKVPLCPSALRELDRRNWLSSQSTSKSTPISTKRITRSATRATEIDQLDYQRSAALKDRTPQLKRFARRGGPNLRDLRGVWMT